MDETIIVTGPETNPAPEPSERILGRLEAEADHLADQVDQVADQVDQVADQVDQVADQVDQVADQVNRSTEVAWDAREEVERLRSEMDSKFQQIMEMLQDEAEDDRESSETETIELPEPVEMEPVAEVKTSRFPDWLI